MNPGPPAAFSRALDPAPAVDPELFPAGFLRLLAMVPSAAKRLHAGAPDGRRVALGEGGRFLFRGHRAYRPGDDLKRLDWKVEARLGLQMVREYDVERDLVTEVWLDGSASLGPCGGRTAAWRAAALALALGVAEGGRARLGVLRDGAAEVRLEAGAPGEVRDALVALTRERPAGRAELAAVVPRLAARVARGVRLVLVSDLLSRADPGILSRFGGRGVRGALLHLRVPEVNAPAPGAPFLARDVETGAERLVVLDAPAAARVAARAQAHADLWSRHAAQVGLRYLPFAPGGDDEALLRRLVLEAS